MVAARLVVPLTVRLHVTISLPEIALLVMVVAASVELPLTFRVPSQRAEGVDVIGELR